MLSIVAQQSWNELVRREVEMLLKGRNSFWEAVEVSQRFTSRFKGCRPKYAIECKSIGHLVSGTVAVTILKIACFYDSMLSSATLSFALENEFKKYFYIVVILKKFFITYMSKNILKKSVTRPIREKALRVWTFTTAFANTSAACNWSADEAQNVFSQVQKCSKINN